MAIVIVGGSARSVGKTTLVCALIAALSEFRWTAVKISGHMHEHPEPIWEESAAGEDSDTERYLAAGAQRSLLVTALEGAFPIATLRAALAQDAHIIFESNRIIDYYKPDLCLAMLGEPDLPRKPSFEKIAQHADAFVVLDKTWLDKTGQDKTLQEKSDASRPKLPPDADVLELVDFQAMSPKLLAWLRERLKHPMA